MSIHAEAGDIFTLHSSTRVRLYRRLGPQFIVESKKTLLDFSNFKQQSPIIHEALSYN
jgi:hypothetical protein